MNIKILQSLFLIFVVAMVTTSVKAAETYLPFVLGSNDAGSIADKLDATKASLAANGFEVVGDYSPFEGAHIIVVTNAELKKEAASHDRAGYIAAQRVSLKEKGGKVQIAYTNPFYMAKAYFIESDLAATSAAMKKALGAMKSFGPEEGLTAKKLGKYHYTFGMEYFDEPLEIAEHKSHEQAVSIIEKNLAAKKSGAFKVYRIDIPGTSQTLIGVGMKAPSPDNKDMDEAYIMNEIDFKETSSLAHLPYEMLVKGGEVEALHARFRIAINFPDLSMMGANSFMNIMSSPDAIRDVLVAVAEGKKGGDSY